VVVGALLFKAAIKMREAGGWCSGNFKFWLVYFKPAWGKSEMRRAWNLGDGGVAKGQPCCRNGYFRAGWTLV